MPETKSPDTTKSDGGNVLNYRFFFLSFSLTFLMYITYIHTYLSMHKPLPTNSSSFHYYLTIHYFKSTSAVLFCTIYLIKYPNSLSWNNHFLRNSSLREKFGP